MKELMTVNICKKVKKYNESLNKNNIRKYLIYIMAIILMFLSFHENIFVSNDTERDSFYLFQSDSEALVTNGIFRDKHELNNSPYGLQYLEINDDKYQTEDYKSQVGLQGRIFSFLSNKLHISTTGLHMICSALLAIVLVNICRLLREKYGGLLAFVFYATFLLSPWVINFANNLYWVEFSWFLPLMLCLLLGKSKNMKLYLPLIFISVLFKCLCGYEYLSTIMLASIAFFIVDFITDKKERKQNLKLIFAVGIVSILAFVLAICIHGFIRGDSNVFSGINSIIQEDVLRRTMGTNAELYENERIKESINASYGEVLKKYLKFSTDLLVGLDGKVFMIFAIGSFAIVVYNIINKKKNAVRDLTLYMVFLMVTLSWYILGKAHSYIHIHMNYVLWYFGYVQITIYIIIKALIEVMGTFPNGVKYPTGDRD